MITRDRLALYAAAFLVSVSTLAHASSYHTWVAYYGNDSNSGTMSSPYADFATAAANTSAGGMISVLTPGDYGAVTITQSITIDGTGGGSITFTGSEGIYVNAPTTATVVVRNLAMNGLGVGADAIYFGQGANLVVENCRLEGFTDIGIGVGSTDTMNVVVTNTVIVGGQLGVRTFQSAGSVPEDSVTLQNVTIQGASSAGIFTRNGTLEVTNSVLQNNVIAVQADTNATLSIESSMIAQNGTAVCVYNPGKIRLENNDIFDNGTGVANCGGTIKTNGNNRDSGNTNGNPVSASDVSSTALF